jgi:6-phosphogluconate dehydrogenase
LIEITVKLFARKDGVVLLVDLMERRMHHPRRLMNDILSHCTAQTANFMAIPFFTNLMNAKIESWTKALASCSLAAIPAPLFGSALNYFDAEARERLAANVIQELRDFFGTHISERVDRPDSLHTIWK